MIQESKKDTGDRMTSAVFLSKPIIEALDVGHIQWTIRHVAEVERQLECQGRRLDFSQCHGVVSEVRSAYRQCLENGLQTQAEALERVFEKYFSMERAGADE